MLSVISFIYGITIGSFLNVCIYRIPNHISIVKPRSRCGSCNRTLTAKDLVPLLSWLLLHGKCRTCGAKIAMRYPLVEALTGVLFMLAYWLYGLSPMTLITWVFLSLMIVVFFIDFDHLIIPNSVVLGGMAMGIPVMVYQLTLGYPLYTGSGWLEIPLGIIVPFVVMLFLALLSYAFAGGAGIGMGDVKIYAPIGLFLGWKLALLSLYLTFVMGGLFGVFWIFILKRDKKAMIPFGPFIAISSGVVMLIGTKVLAIM